MNLLVESGNRASTYSTVRGTMELDRFRTLQSKFEALQKKLDETQDFKAQAVIFAEVRQIIAEMKELIDCPQSHRLNKI